MIIVQRGSGDKKGGTITSTVLTDIQSQIYVGRTEINSSASKTVFTCRPILFNSIPKPYQFNSIVYNGETKIGRITTVSLQQRSDSTSLNILVEVPK